MSTIGDLVSAVRSAALPKAAIDWTQLEADNEARTLAFSLSRVQEDQREVSHRRFALRAQLAKMAGFKEVDYADARAGAVAMDMLSKAAAIHHPDSGAELASLTNQAEIGLTKMRERAVELGAVVRATYPSIATFWIGPMPSRRFQAIQARPSQGQPDNAADALRLKQIETLGFLAMLTLIVGTPPLAHTAGSFRLEDPPPPEGMDKSQDAYMRHIEMCGFTALIRREVTKANSDVFYEQSKLERELAELRA